MIEVGDTVLISVEGHDYRAKVYRISGDSVYVELLEGLEWFDKDQSRWLSEVKPLPR